jgi:hypothetical protein
MTTLSKEQLIDALSQFLNTKDLRKPKQHGENRQMNLYLF